MLLLVSLLYFGVFLAVYIIYLILKFVLYIFQSLGLLRIAKKENYKYPYIVWLPGLSHYVLGNYCLDKKKSIFYSILGLVHFVVPLILNLRVIYDMVEDIIMPIYIILVIVYFIVDMLVMNKFYKKVYKKNELFTILTIITFGMLKPIFIYTARIKKITNVDI